MSPPARLWQFRLLAITIGLAIALFLGELLLAGYDHLVSGNEKMAPGLVVYDEQLGWKPAAGWQGSHRHFDYNVTYSTDSRRFRTSTERAFDRDATVTALFGDSFTFGLGVDDAQTFTSVLNTLPGSRRWINAGVPGYSPEQVWLWMQQARVLAGADEIFFVVYLGNDLVDIGLDYAVQSPWAKPAATFSDDGEFRITNIPVPRVPKPPALAARTLASYVLGDGASAPAAWERLRLWRLVIGAVEGQGGAEDTALQESMTPKLRLFSALLEEIRRGLPIPIHLAVLPGQSAADSPRSVSGRYQLLVRDELESIAAEQDVGFLDLTPDLASAGAPVFFANDGHLTPAGHRIVADAINRYLSEK